MNEAEIKQAANEYVQRFRGSGSKIIGRNAFSAGAEANSSKWILVTERMPPERTLVLMFIPKQDDYVGSGFWEKSQGWYESYELTQINDYVTHWRPLDDTIPSPTNTQP